MAVGRKFTVSGLVQGVGYRQHCAMTARELGLKGYVRNLMSGDVEIEVYGDAGKIREFISGISADGFAFEVSGINAEDIDARGIENYAGFIIRH